ncbi:MAG: DMT family transporter [Pelagimonas sp.]|jgi:drug/metabolite transporter (DMT)-like permease|nr:DMT family transporter [Pelagimonas sp.]
MNPTLRACLWMSGAIISFSVMAIAGRAVSLDLDTFEIMLFRSLIGVVIMLAVIQVAGLRDQINARDLPLHALRNLSHFAGQNLWFYSITVLPLAQVFALEFTTPFWVMLLAPLVLGEQLTKARALSALVGFVGILIVTRPDPQGLVFGQLTAALCAVGFAGSAVFTRRLTRTHATVNILLWLTLMQAVFGVIFAGYDASIAWPEATAWPWLISISLAGLVAHYCLTTALSLAPASVVIPVDFIRLPLIALVGMWLYAEAFDPFVALGALVIFGANYANILHESRKTTVTKT